MVWTTDGIPTLSITGGPGIHHRGLHRLRLVVGTGQGTVQPHQLLLRHCVRQHRPCAVCTHRVHPTHHEYQLHRACQRAPSRRCGLGVFPTPHPGSENPLFAPTAAQRPGIRAVARLALPACTPASAKSLPRAFIPKQRGYASSTLPRRKSRPGSAGPCGARAARSTEFAPDTGKAHRAARAGLQRPLPLPQMSGALTGLRRLGTGGRRRPRDDAARLALRREV